MRHPPAVRLAILRALRARVLHEDDHAVGELRESMDVGDAKSARLDDGTPLGRVLKVKGRSTPTVVDERALLAWVRKNRPDEIVEGVRPSYLHALKEQAKKHGAPFDTKTGEVIPGIELRDGDPSIRFDSEPGYEDVVAERWPELADRSIFQLPAGHDGH